MTFRQSLSLSLSVLIASPLWASVGVIGTVQTSKLATLRGANLVAGTTVCDGDTIHVAPQGSAWVSLPGGGAVLIGQNSEISFQKTAQAAAEFEIESGQVKFRSSDASSVHAILGDASIESLKGPAIGYITMYGQTSAIIGAEKGDILITLAHDGSTKTLHEGSAIAVRLVPDSLQTGDDVIPAKNRRRRIIFWGAVIVGSATFIGVLLNDDEKKVSPSNFQ
ncbi:MAG TPA: hypothetical protein VGS15_01460 [Candidatus Acidoferrales bacterium]|nr:hypothetical protein [Candidatus Acidoferrales bacterium]